MIHQFHENKKLLTNSLSLTIFFGGVALPGLLYGIVCLWPLVMMPHHQISGGSPDHLQTRTASGQKQLLEAPGVVSQRWNLPVNPRQWSDIHDCKPFFFVFFFPSSKSCPKNLKFITVGYYFWGFFYDGYCTGFFREKHVSQMRTSRYPLVVFRATVCIRTLATALSGRTRPFVVPVVGVGRSSIGRHAKCRFSSFPPKESWKKCWEMSQTQKVMRCKSFPQKSLIQTQPIYFQRS